MALLLRVDVDVEEGFEKPGILVNPEYFWEENVETTAYYPYSKISTF